MDPPSRPTSWKPERPVTPVTPGTLPSRENKHLQAPQSASSANAATSNSPASHVSRVQRFSHILNPSTPGKDAQHTRSSQPKYSHSPNKDSSARNVKFNLKNFGRNAMNRRHNHSHVHDRDLPMTALARIAQNAKNNLRLWYLRHNNSESHRKTEFEIMREREKSETLFSQLFVVTPIILLAASSLQTEEGNEKKVPVMLQQISFKVTVGHAKHYHHMIKISMEYGAGFAAIRWDIIRGYRDFQVLWSKLKSANFRPGIRGKKLDLPKLPNPKHYENLQKTNATENQQDGDQNSENVDDLNEGEDFGYLTEDDGSTDPGDDDDDDEDEDEDDEENGSGDEDSDHEHSNSSRPHKARTYTEALENWLNKVKHIYMFRSDSNDLMRFLELSHLGLKLSAEYFFHGKEGSLIVRSRASDLGWRVSHLHPHDFKDMITRHTKKWVLVRDSYIVIVDNIYSTRIREVFMVDPYFDVRHVKQQLNDAITQAVSRRNTITQGTAPPNLDNKEDELPAVITRTASAAPNVPPSAKKSMSAKSVFLHLSNNSRELKLAAMSERDLRRWQSSILQMQHRTLWSKEHRFDSYAPVRTNVFGQWFVDARDYMWVLSEALESARDTIFILDWWLSPELYLRRPAEGNQNWRLDRMLRRKAEQGVKIFVIVYRNVGPTIPIDSLWTKHSLLDLHPNIHVMRSPYQLKNKNALFWAHHEKLCVIDNTVAFNGGIDLCYGRWDTWQHVLTDNAKDPFLPENPSKDDWNTPTQLFVGKDYSNARVKDFYELNKPYEDMYDRNYVPRMPWHDIHQMVVGQPSRDLARHFVQRWNYVLRQKAPSRLTPLLLPPPDFTQEELERMQLTGTCEYQVLRSSGPWSLGLKKHEQSIQNAYLKLIEESEHLVYIENQFFITSTVVDGILIENKIGDALVQRIIKAHERQEKWKAFILIPLLPGFEADVGTEKASSVRVICQCQFNSISRGKNSIFSRLESVGIRPDRYIHFFSLRKWGKFVDSDSSSSSTKSTDDSGAPPSSDLNDSMVSKSHSNSSESKRTASSIAVDAATANATATNTAANTATTGGTSAAKPAVPKDRITTEILYIHAKCMIVDDRVAIIGSANINERSMRGDRDSEVAVCVRDTKIVESKMAGKPWKAAKFAHSLRVRLMREHLGVDIDNLEIVERSMDLLDNIVDLKEKRESQNAVQDENASKAPSNSDESKDLNQSENNRESENQKNSTKDNENDHDKENPYPSWLYPELHSYNWYAGTNVNRGIRDHKKFSYDSRVQNNSEHKADVDGKGQDHWYSRQSQQEGVKSRHYQAAEPDFILELNAQEVLNKLLQDTTISSRSQFKRKFYDLLTNQNTQRPVKSVRDLPIPQTDETGTKAENNENIPIDPWTFDDPLDTQFVDDKWIAAAERNTLIFRLVFRCQPDDDVETWKDYKTFLSYYDKFCENQKVCSTDGTVMEQSSDQGDQKLFADSDDELKSSPNAGEHVCPTEENINMYPTFSSFQSTNSNMISGINTRRMRRLNHFNKVMSAQVAEDMLQGITGHLVMFPTEWLNRELDSGNWNFQLDRIAPLEIYD